MRRVAKAARMEERTPGRNAAARKEVKGKRKAAREKTRTCWTCGKTGHIAAWCRSADEASKERRKSIKRHC